ncbi:hypothetical protein FRC09_009959 [Ceratobasidium sp. 395]|nr:hypothetical protein FRC09_009959 [Ceratobasidium sp. 395]
MADTSPEVTNPDLDYLDRALTTADIVSLVARSLPEHWPRVRVTKYHKKNKTKLLKLLLDDDEYWTQELYKIAIENEEEGVRARREKNRQHRKQGKAARQSRARQAILEEKFFEVPSEEEVLRCYSEARKATLNASLEHRICAVCAHLRHAPEAAFTEMKVTSIPNRHKLVPHTHVPNQTLTHGCLLEPKGCYGNEPDLMANICKECLDELKQPARDTPPKHSLANNLWVGEIPWELECLTFAEQLLIARIYPRVFIMKLYPKDQSGRNLPGDQVNSALRGNVTSFELNGPAIANMVAGQLMPQPVSVLASTLSITFVGRGKLKDPNTLNMLRVRRNAIENALIWLQKNNPKYYGDIKIDKTRLRDLPSDGVPEAILAGIRYKTNEAMADEEHQGYVPESYYSDNADTEDEECDDGDVIPLQHLGVMDNDLTKMPTDELLKWGLRNMEGSVDVSHQEPGYAIQYGAPVNTFGQPPQGYGPGDPNRRNFWEAAFPLLYPYGVGGIESDRPVALSLNAQARWSLEYHDRRFRYHPTFMFTAFGILQRRQGLLSAKLQMRRRDFDALAVKPYSE